MHTKRLLPLIVFFGFLTAGSAFAQRVYYGQQAQRYLNEAEIVRFKAYNPLYNYIKLRPDGYFSVDYFSEFAQKVFGLNADYTFQAYESFTDRFGITHVRIQEYYKGIKVEYGNYILHVENGLVTSLNGEIYGHLPATNTPSIPKNIARNAAINAVGAQKYKWEIPVEEEFIKEQKGPNATFFPVGSLVYVPVSGKYNSPKPEWKLAYKFNIYAQTPIGRYNVYVDANTGSPIWKMSIMHVIDVTGTAQTGYSGQKTIITDSTGTTYRLRETGRGGGIETYDMNTGTNYGNAVDFTDSDNNWNNVNAQEDQYATDAHYGAEMTYDYYYLVHGRNSIDGNGFKLLSYVHYDTDYDNAFWDGQRMTYGDGDNTFTTPLTTIDITGHEITHGLTSNTSGLIYQNESGALNESFSDIFGVTIDKYARNTPAPQLWLMGDECTGGGGIRNMSDPVSYGDPDTYLGPQYYTGSADNGGVHTNSGVQNYWYYLLCQGGSGTNGVGDSYNVTAIGMNKAATIAFANDVTKLTANSNYADARFYSIIAAIEIYGPCSQEVISTTNAWYAVGVGLAFDSTVVANFSASATAFCQTPALVTFTNLSQNSGSFYWDFGDGDTSTTTSPTHIYNTTGTFTVTLIAYGGSCGTDSLVQTALITVDPNIPCQITLDQNNQNIKQNSCVGTLFDSGGPNADYQNSVTSTITINPPQAATVTLTFTQFDLENGWDFLYIYDGPNDTYPLLGSLTGTNLPSPITSTGNAITIKQVTDQYVTEPGFTINWSCQVPTTPPVVNFTASSVQSCNGIISFQDQTTNGASSWHWDFGDGDTSNLQNPTHVYQADGIYTVTLTVTNIIGSDSLIKTNYIAINRPDTPLIADQYLCVPGTATFTGTTTSGTIYWFADNAGNTLLDTGATYTTPFSNISVTYYAQTTLPQPSQYVGPQDNTIGGGNNHGNSSTQYLEFDVFQNVTLKSAWVLAAGNGYRTINLWDAVGNLIDSRTINIQNGAGRITLNFNLTPGSYRIGGTQMDLYRNNSGPNYPYTQTGLVSITGSSAGNNYYYYLYDWELELPACTSPIIPVDLIFAPVTANFTSNINNNTVTFNNTSSTSGSVFWDFGDNNTSTQVNPVHTYGATGTYQVTLIVSNGHCSDTITKSVTISKIGLNNYPSAKININVFPNPSSDVVWFNLTNTQNFNGNIKVRITDLAGRQILSSNIIPSGNKATFSWNKNSLAAPGVYFAKFEIASQTVTKKFVIK